MLEPGYLKTYFKYNIFNLCIRLKKRKKKARFSLSPLQLNVWGEQECMYVIALTVPGFFFFCSNQPTPVVG